MRSTFTPTAASAVVSGFGLWVLLWAIAQKTDTILAMFGLRDRAYAQRVREWINNNKGLTMCATEVVNLAHSGTGALGVPFAIGGTVCNFIFIFLVNPFLCRHHRNKIFRINKKAA